MMNFENYATGVSYIDNQHRQIMDLTNNINQVRKYMGDDLKLRIVRDNIAYLTNCVDVHFAAEEALMDFIKYESVEHQIHLDQHNYFRKMINATPLREFDSEAVDKLILQITLWFQIHIGQHDKRLCEELLKKQKLLK